MLCKDSKLFVGVIALVAAMAWANSASADIVASFTGPQTFTGTLGTGDSVALPAVSIGLEGTVSLEFQSVANAEGDTTQRCMWYNADVAGGGQGEYCITYSPSLGYISGDLWSNGSYAARSTAVFTPDANWHSIVFSWKQDQPTRLLLDGVETTVTNSKSLVAFTSGNNMDLVGKNGYPAGVGCQPFLGSIRNVVVSDTYYSVQTPEPSALALCGIGLVSLLAYAWRKRK